MYKRSLLFSLPFVLVVAGCATTSTGGSSGRSSNVLLAEEIAESSVNNAYQAIERLRPRWLQNRTRTMTSPRGVEPVVYLDGMPAGGIRELISLQANRVVRMQYMSPTDATNRFGTNHEGGAILITTR